MNAAGRSHWPNRCGLAITDAPRPDAADRDLPSGRQRDKVEQPSLFQRREVLTRVVLSMLDIASRSGGAPKPRHDRARLPGRECRQSGDHHRAARTGRTDQSTALITMCASGQSSTGTIVERI